MRASLLFAPVVASLLAATAPAPRAAADAELTSIVGASIYRSAASSSVSTVKVAAFRMDREPATNADFLGFVASRPEWRRDRVARVFADEQYLSHWRDATTLDGAGPHEPVVHVSWFAARAYCAARGMRLPSEAEWEVAAAASPTRPDGGNDPAWTAELLAVYSRPALAKLPDVGGQPNFWGLRDMHGLVWEWVDDFSATGPVDCNQTVGGTVGAALDFPAFERSAMRSALHGDTTTPNLGFRCAVDLAREEAR